VGPGPLIVGTDFSSGAGSALIYARQLSEISGGVPLVIHAITSLSEALWEADSTATRWLESFGLPARQLDARAGDPWLVLLHVAEELRASGIVLGSHGRSGPRPSKLGSVATRVSLTAPCPVVIVPPRVANLLTRYPSHSRSQWPRDTLSISPDF
jgi:nucleotide-binding universal stress UspA family protein